MGRALLGLVCGCGGIAAVAMVAAGLLRLAIAVANRSIGAKSTAPTAQSRSGRIAEWDWDDWDDEGDLEPVRPWRAGNAIPEPGMFKCALIMFLTALAYGFSCVVTNFAGRDMGFRMGRDEAQLALGVLNLPVGGLVLAVLLALFLPTGFWRAAMVAFVYCLLVLAFVLFIGVLAFVVR